MDWVRVRISERGTSTVEFAGTFLLWTLWIMVSLQFALIAAQYFSLQQATRDTARWAAIQVHVDDATVRNRLISTSSNGLVGAGAAGISSMTVSPACPALSGGKCAGRLPGGPLSVTVAPNISRVLFLPATFGAGPLTVRIPTTVGAITMTTTIE